ncbi:MAG: protein kinase [Candidatus Obscuribacterales bacterium]
MTIGSTTQSNEFEPGEVLGGRYRVVSALGRGGMGIVYKVEQIYLGLELALKTIDRSSLTDVSVRRFQAEAKAVFSLNHPNIISVHDFGLLDDQTPFLAMEFIQGESLAARLKRGALPISEVLPMFIQVCKGLAHAHEHSVVHRDIKPGNIMLLDQLSIGTEGSIKILDFGIAKLGDQEDGGVQSVTRTGEIFGSPLYMSPEQCAGSKVDHRSDIYSLGCVMFESLTGTTPFVGESALSTMMFHQSERVPSLKEASLGNDFPPALEQIVQTMLAKNPEDRYQSLNEAASDLAALERGENLQHVRSASNQSSSASGAKAKTKSDTKTISIRRETLIGTIVGTVLLSATSGVGSTTILLASQKPAAITAVPSEISPLPPQSDPSEMFAPDIRKNKVSFKSGWDTTNENLLPFKNYDKIQKLELKQCPVNDDGLAVLQNARLLELTVSCCSISSVKNISKLSYLQTLDLSDTAIDDSALPELAKLKMLKSLSIRNCKKVTEKGLMGLSTSTSLLNVVLTEKHFSTDAILRLREKMPQCSFEGYGLPSKCMEVTSRIKPEQIYAVYKKAIELAQQVNPNLSVIGQLEAGISQYFENRHDYAQAEEWLKKARLVLENNGNKYFLSQILAQSGLLAIHQNKLEECDKFFDESARLSLETMMHDSPDLMGRLEAVTAQPFNSPYLENSLKYSKIAITLIKEDAGRTPALQTYLPRFCERAGHELIVLKKDDEALPYLLENYKIRKMESAQNPKRYALSLVLLGKAEPTNVEKKRIWNEALDLMDSLNHPSDLNLKECYCDCSVALMGIFESEKNHTEAVNYARRGLTVAEKILDDTYDRKTYLKKLVIRQLYRAGRETEARKEAAKYGFSWSADLQ